MSPVLWASVNGWVVPVTGTATSEGDPTNRVDLFPPPSSDARIDFVFLEVFKVLVSDSANATGTITITVNPVANTYSAFVVAAEAASGVASGGELVGVLQAQGADPSAFTFSLNSGRTDLFEIDGTGTNLVQVGGTDPGLAGAVNYIRIQAANAAATNNLVVAVQVVDGTPSTTLFMFR